MDKATLLLYLAMYIYGFSLTIWAIFYHKYRTNTTRNVAIGGLIGLILTVFYVIYALVTIGIK